MAEEYRSQEGSAPFNMALATLERISDILRSITKNDADPFTPMGTKQSTKVQLVKNLYFNSVPLLEEKDDKLMNEILGLEDNTTQIIKKDGDHIKSTDGIKQVFDKKLETKLDKLIIKISRKLQEGKFFMPPKKDLSLAVTEM